MHLADMVSFDMFLDTAETHISEVGILHLSRWLLRLL